METSRFWGWMLVLFLSGSAVAMQMQDVPVRCTMPNGKVTNERGSCPPGAKIEVTRSASDRPAPDASTPGQWSYNKVTDSMTGKTQCIATSPRSYLRVSRPHEVPEIYAMVTVVQSRPTLSIHLESGKVFHHNVADTGLKAGNAGFVAFASRPSQTKLALQPGTDSFVVDDMLRAQDLRIRTRLWPWDELVEGGPISLAGFKQAYTLAVACSM